MQPTGFSEITQSVLEHAEFGRCGSGFAWVALCRHRSPVAAEAALTGTRTRSAWAKPQAQRSPGPVRPKPWARALQRHPRRRPWRLARSHGGRAGRGLPTRAPRNLNNDPCVALSWASSRYAQVGVNWGGPSALPGRVARPIRLPAALPLKSGADEQLHCEDFSVTAAPCRPT